MLTPLRNRLPTRLRQYLCRHKAKVHVAALCKTQALHLHRVTSCMTCKSILIDETIPLSFPGIIDLPPAPLIQDPDHRYH